MTVQEPTVPSHGPLVWPKQRLRSFMSFGPIREIFRPLNPDFRRSDMKLTDKNGRLFERRLLTFISVSLKNRLEAIFTWRSLSGRVRWTRLSADCPCRVRVREFWKNLCPCPPFLMMSVSAPCPPFYFLWYPCPLRVRGQGRTKVSATPVVRVHRTLISGFQIDLATVVSKWPRNDPKMTLNWSSLDSLVTWCACQPFF